MIYAIDFDGTLCTNAYPEIGQPKTAVINYVYNLHRNGHKLILSTCREEKSLAKAIQWCALQGLIFDAYNKNLPEKIAEYGGDCRKISADFYIDDKNLMLYEGVGMIERV